MRLGEAVRVSWWPASNFQGLIELKACGSCTLALMEENEHAKTQRKSGVELVTS
ncbi:MAG: hypothetical protein AAF394_13220 [Planctomycetota bacterium]